MREHVAVVTGGAGGLGRYITLSLARRGLTVVIADTDHHAAARLLDELHSSGHRGRFIDTDASEAASIRRLMGRVPEVGFLTVLINNAGGWLPGSQFPQSDQWRRSIDLNLVMPMLAAQLAVPLMAGRGGGIVNVASSGGLGPPAYGSPDYAAAKAGLIRFTTSIADWHDRYRIQVNCVVAHWIGLDRAIQQFNQMTEDERQRSGGLVDPHLVAATIADLALDTMSTGRVVVLRAGTDPYDIDLESADPWDQ